MSTRRWDAGGSAAGSCTPRVVMRVAMMLSLLGGTLVLFGLATGYLEHSDWRERLVTQPALQPPTITPLPFLGIGFIAIGVLGANVAFVLRRQSERITDLEARVIVLQHQVDTLSRPEPLDFY